VLHHFGYPTNQNFKNVQNVIEQEFSGFHFVIIKALGAMELKAMGRDEG
jgi:hypothetical protein